MKFIILVIRCGLVQSFLNHISSEIVTRILHCEIDSRLQTLQSFNVERLFCGQRCVVRLADEDEINTFILFNCAVLVSRCYLICRQSHYAKMC